MKKIKIFSARARLSTVHYFPVETERTVSATRRKLTEIEAREKMLLILREEIYTFCE